jgi:hypothetical protein
MIVVILQVLIFIDNDLYRQLLLISEYYLGFVIFYIEKNLLEMK